MYYGAFGAHTAMVIRRLRRLCHHYGTDPVFIIASATIANPQHHAQVLIGVPHVHLVDEDGSPHGPKTFVMWNPPLVRRFDPKTDRRGGPSGTDLGGGPSGTRPPSLHSVEEQNSGPGPSKNKHKTSAGGPSKAPSGAPSDRLPRRRSKPAVVQRAAGTERLGVASDDSHAVQAAAPVCKHDAETDAPVCKHDARTDAASAKQPMRISNEELSAAREALASVQVHGLPCRVDREPSLSRPRADLVPVSCMLLTSKGRRHLGAMEGGARLLALRREADQRIPTPAEARQRLKGHAVAKWEEEGRRVSPVVEVAMLLAECIRHGLRTIAFCKSRKLCELVATYVHERLRCYPLLASSFKVDKPHQCDAVMLDSFNSFQKQGFVC